MSPSQFHDEHAIRRPPELKISKDSHGIHKQSSSSSSSSTATSALTTAVSRRHPPPQQQRHPVIIYTHSPKIIRTEARDFMALVQKLTGMSRSDDPPPPASAGPADVSSSSSGLTAGSDDALSVLKDENRSMGGVQVAAASFDSPNNRFLPEIPLFAPNSSDFFCSPHSIYRYPDSVFPSPNMVSPISPSVMEFLKAYPDY